MKRAFLQWFFKPAFWWEFWLPNSGFRGGLLFSWVCCSFIYIGKLILEAA